MDRHLGLRHQPPFVVRHQTVSFEQVVFRFPDGGAPVWLEIEGIEFCLTNRQQPPIPASAAPAPSAVTAVPVQTEVPAGSAPAAPPALAETSFPARAEIPQACAANSAAWISQGGLKQPLQPVYIPPQPQQGQYLHPGWDQQRQPPPQCEVCGGPHFPQDCPGVLPQDRGFFAIHPLNRRGLPPSQQQHRRPQRQGNRHQAERRLDGKRSRAAAAAKPRDKPQTNQRSDPVSHRKRSGSSAARKARTPSPRRGRSRTDSDDDDLDDTVEVRVT